MGQLWHHQQHHQEHTIKQQQHQNQQHHQHRHRHHHQLVLRGLTRTRDRERRRKARQRVMEMALERKRRTETLVPMMAWVGISCTTSLNPLITPWFLLIFFDIQIIVKEHLDKCLDSVVHNLEEKIAESNQQLQSHIQRQQELLQQEIAAQVQQLMLPPKTASPPPVHPTTDIHNPKLNTPEIVCTPESSKIVAHPPISSLPHSGVEPKPQTGEKPLKSPESTVNSTVHPQNYDVHSAPTRTVQSLPIKETSCTQNTSSVTHLHDEDIELNEEFPILGETTDALEVEENDVLIESRKPSNDVMKGEFSEVTINPVMQPLHSPKQTKSSISLESHDPQPALAILCPHISHKNSEEHEALPILPLNSVTPQLNMSPSQEEKSTVVATPHIHEDSTRDFMPQPTIEKKTSAFVVDSPTSTELSVRTEASVSSPQETGGIQMTPLVDPCGSGVPITSFESSVDPRQMPPSLLGGEDAHKQTTTHQVDENVVEQIVTNDTPPETRSTPEVDSRQIGLVCVPTITEKKEPEEPLQQILVLTEPSDCTKALGDLPQNSSEVPKEHEDDMQTEHSDSPALSAGLVVYDSLLQEGSKSEKEERVFINRDGENSTLKTNNENSTPLVRTEDCRVEPPLMEGDANPAPKSESFLLVAISDQLSNQGSDSAQQQPYTNASCQNANMVITPVPLPTTCRVEYVLPDTTQAMIGPLQREDNFPLTVPNPVGSTSQLSLSHEGISFTSYTPTATVEFEHNTVPNAISTEEPIETLPDSTLYGTDMKIPEVPHFHTTQSGPSTNLMQSNPSLSPSIPAVDISEPQLSEKNFISCEPDTLVYTGNQHEFESTHSTIPILQSEIAETNIDESPVARKPISEPPKDSLSLIPSDVEKFIPISTPTKQLPSTNVLTLNVGITGVQDITMIARTNFPSPLSEDAITENSNQQATIDTDVVVQDSICTKFNTNSPQSVLLSDSFTCNNDAYLPSMNSQNLEEVGQEEQSSLDGNMPSKEEIPQCEILPISSAEQPESPEPSTFIPTPSMSLEGVSDALPTSDSRNPMITSPECKEPELLNSVLIPLKSSEGANDNFPVVRKDDENPGAYVQTDGMQNVTAPNNGQILPQSTPPRNTSQTTLMTPPFISAETVRFYYSPLTPALNQCNKESGFQREAGVASTPLKAPCPMSKLIADKVPFGLSEADKDTLRQSGPVVINNHSGDLEKSLDGEKPSPCVEASQPQLCVPQSDPSSEIKDIDDAKANMSDENSSSSESSDSSDSNYYDSDTGCSSGTMEDKVPTGNGVDKTRFAKFDKLMESKNINSQNSSSVLLSEKVNGVQTRVSQPPALEVHRTPSRELDRAQPKKDTVFLDPRADPTQRLHTATEVTVNSQIHEKLNKLNISCPQAATSYVTHHIIEGTTNTSSQSAFTEPQDHAQSPSPPSA
ncbi:hypothetical protein Pelo_17290 [Pelomyxa schiedti]|nr:hypothetical protein Pelo_17290 [Pelomyxa schiedti]